MSNIDKQALRKRYSEKPTPKCDICGARMTIQRMSGSRVTYGCSGAIYDETGCHYAEGRSLADDHYEQSRVTVTDESDPDVLALLDELEAAESRIAELSHHLQCAHGFIEHTEVFGHEASNGILCCGDAQWDIDASKSALAAAAKGE